MLSEYLRAYDFVHEFKSTVAFLFKNKGNKDAYLRVQKRDQINNLCCCLIVKEIRLKVIENASESVSFVCLQLSTRW